MNCDTCNNEATVLATITKPDGTVLDSCAFCGDCADSDDGQWFRATAQKAGE